MLSQLAGPAPMLCCASSSSWSSHGLSPPGAAACCVPTAFPRWAAPALFRRPVGACPVPTADPPGAAQRFLAGLLPWGSTARGDKFMAGPHAMCTLRATTHRRTWQFRASKAHLQPARTMLRIAQTKTREATKRAAPPHARAPCCAGRRAGVLVRVTQCAPRAPGVLDYWMIR